MDVALGKILPNQDTLVHAVVPSNPRPQARMILENCN
jgi:hypothetical protein